MNYDIENDDDLFTGKDHTPLRKDAFEKSPLEKMEIIQEHFHAIMETLGMDMTDDSLKGSPKRVAKMYVNEIFGGLLPENKPGISTFSNKYKYRQMLVEKDISFYSNCEHHFVPIIGKAHVAYIGKDKVIGLSKLNRIVQHYAKRPQVQERMTMQIAEELKNTLQTENIAVIIEAKHLCVSSRGVSDNDSSTVTSFYGGKFLNENTKQEFLRYLS